MHRLPTPFTKNKGANLCLHVNKERLMLSDFSFYTMDEFIVHPSALRDEVTKVDTK